MNLIDCYVTKVLSKKPVRKYGYWWVKVCYVSEGVPGEHTLMCTSEENAKNIKPGHHFLA